MLQHLGCVLGLVPYPVLTVMLGIALQLETAHVQKLVIACVCCVFAARVCGEAMKQADSGHMRLSNRVHIPFHCRLALGLQ